MSKADTHDFVMALRRIEGQARGVQKMIETGRPCDEVIQQLSAMRAAIDRLGPRYIAANLRACLSDSVLLKDDQTQMEEGLAALAELRR